jgi:precorrin-6B methylase 2
MASFSSLTSFPYLDHYLKLALVEGELLHINNDSQVVFIGGGPLPLTPICMYLLELAKQEGLLETLVNCLDKSKDDEKVLELKRILRLLDKSEFKGKFHAIAVDCEEDAVELASTIIDFLGLHQAISVLECDGRELDIPSSFNTFMIASMVTGKEHVLENILNQLPKGEVVRMSVRSVEHTNLRRLLYEPAEPVLAKFESRYKDLVKESSFTPPPGSFLINSVHVYSYHKEPAPVCRQKRQVRTKIKERGTTHAIHS